MNQATHDNGKNLSRLMPGLLLIGFGLLALFGNLGLNLFGNLLGTLIFGVLAYSVYQHGVRTGRQGMRLLAVALAGLAVVTLLPGSATGALFLAFSGLAFAVVWRADRNRWWAILPAGALASLAATAALSRLPGSVTGFVFLGGMAATFYALTRLSVQPQSWAIYPAAGIAAVAVLALVGGGGSWLFPLLLLAAGVVLLARSGVIEVGSLTGRFRGGRAAAAPVTGDDVESGLVPTAPAPAGAGLAPTTTEDAASAPREE